MIVIFSDIGLIIKFKYVTNICNIMKQFCAIIVTKNIKIQMLFFFTDNFKYNSKELLITLVKINHSSKTTCNFL